MGNTLILHR